MKKIAFDFDGTIVDSMPQLTELALAVIKEHKLMHPIAARAAYLATTGLPFGEQLRMMSPFTPLLNFWASKEFEARKRQIYDTATLMPGALEVTDALLDLDWDVYVVSSTIAPQDLLRDRLDPRVKISGYESGSKRDQLANIDPLFFVGDSELDATMVPFGRFIGFKLREAGSVDYLIDVLEVVQ